MERDLLNYIAESLLMSLDEAMRDFAGKKDLYKKITGTDFTGIELQLDAELKDIYNSTKKTSLNALTDKEYNDMDVNSSKFSVGTQTATSASNQSSSSKNIDLGITKEKWPKYKDFRKKWYSETLAKGWPSDVSLPIFDKAVKTDKSLTGYLDEFVLSPYIFTKFNKGMNLFGITNKKIKDELYNRFKDDIPGLRKLASLLDNIINSEKAYLEDKKTKGVSGALNALANGVFSGLGFNDRDKALLKWFLPNSKKMTIFQYQKMIIDEMLILLEVDDNTAANLSKMLDSIYKAVKGEQNMTKTKVTTAYERGNYIARFTISNAAKGSYSVFDPFVLCLELLVESAKNDKFDYPKTDTEKKRYLDILDALKALIKSGDAKLDFGKTKGETLIRKFDGGFIFKKTDYKKDSAGDPTKEELGEYIYRLDYLAAKCIVSVIYSTEGLSDEE